MELICINHLFLSEINSLHTGFQHRFSGIDKKINAEYGVRITESKFQLHTYNLNDLEQDS